MALQFEVESLDAVDESLQSLYQEHDGKFRLAVEGIDPADELKGALRKEREERKAATERAQALEAAQKAAEREKAEQKGEFEKLWKQSEEERATSDAKYKELQQQIQDKDIDSALNSIGATLTKDAEKRADIAALYRQNAKFTDTGVIFEVGGVEMSATDFASMIAEQRPYLVDGNQSSGGGAEGGTGGGAANNVPKGNLAGDRSDRKAAIRAMFPDLNK